MEELLSRLHRVIEAAGIPYMLTGSYASSVHGTPRATQDIDIVIAPSESQLTALIRQFPEPAYYVSEDAAREALAIRSQFNVVDLATGWKVDFIIRKDRAFSLTEFDRRESLQFGAIVIDVASAEDVLLSKLELARAGASKRQIEDAAGIIRLQGEKLDRKYIAYWVEQLQIEEEWGEAMTQAGEET